MMLVFHRLRDTWREKISRYIVLNESCLHKFHRGGLPLDKLRIKPNFVESKSEPGWSQRHGGIFIGRLAEEKGILILAQSLARLPGKYIDVYGKCRIL